MNRADKISGVILALVFLGAMYESSKLEMIYRNAPGLGFFPFWISLFEIGRASCRERVCQYV
jgi:hypothetical protein